MQQPAANPRNLRQVANLLIPRKAFEPSLRTAATFLVVSERNNLSRWGLPGGKEEEGETSLQAALRETFEEVGAKAPETDVRLLHAGECTGDGGYETCWVSTYMWVPPAGTLVPPLTMEDGIAGDWHTAAQLCDSGLTPYSRYHRSLFAAYTSLLAQHGTSP